MMFARAAVSSSAGRVSTSTTRRVSNSVLQRSSPWTKNSAMARRWKSSSESTTTTTATEAAVKEEVKSSSTGWWSDPKFWGGLGALAGWGMSGAAIYDASQQGPEVISLTMTPVLIVYSTLFARWAAVVSPPNPLLMWCHVANVTAQLNQFRRAMQYKLDNGQEDQVKDLMTKIGMGGAAVGIAIAAGPKARSVLSTAGLGVVSTVAAAEAGPFTVHFWAPMSKWGISGASFLELDRPTDKISLPQYTALTLTGFFFSRYALLVQPINYTLCSVNIALFGSSAWHLGRKIKADFIDEKKQPSSQEEK